MAKKLIGKTPEFGIPESEEETIGMLCESLEFTWQSDSEDSSDHQGNTVGKMYYNERIGVSISGAVPLGGSVTIKGGDVLTLANTAPALWMSTPAATTTVVEEVKHTYGNKSAAKVDITATIYPFGTATAA